MEMAYLQRRRKRGLKWGFTGEEGDEAGKRGVRGSQMLGINSSLRNDCFPS